MFAIVFVLSTLPIAGAISTSCPLDPGHLSFAMEQNADGVTTACNAQADGTGDQSSEICCSVACGACKTLISASMGAAQTFDDAVPPPSLQANVRGIAPIPQLGPPRT